MYMCLKLLILIYFDSIYVLWKRKCKVLISVYTIRNKYKENRKTRMLRGQESLHF